MRALLTFPIAGVTIAPVMPSSFEPIDSDKTRRFNEALAHATEWTDKLRGELSFLGYFLDRDQLTRLFDLAGHAELLADMPKHPPEGTVTAYGRVANELIDTGLSPQEFLRLYTQVIKEEIAANQALEDWLRREGGSIDLRRELLHIGRLTRPDGDDWDDEDIEKTEWYKAMLQLITRVRDEVVSGKPVVMPDEIAAMSEKLSGKS